jgi:outer membrane protein
MKTFRWLLATSIAVLFMQSVIAADFDAGDTGARPITLGAGILFRDKVYDDYEDSDKIQPVPLILYEGDRFFFRASNMGWKFIRGGEWEVAAIMEFEGDGYDESSSDTLDGMDDRDPYIGAGGEVTWQPSKWGFTLKGTTDIASESDGSQFSGNVHWTNKSGPFITKLSGGGTWMTDDFVDYYFGVKASEAIPTVRPRYAPSEEMSYDVAGLLLYQQDTSPWLIAGGLKFTMYGDEVDDSPITSDDQELALFFGVGYTFRK